MSLKWGRECNQQPLLKPAFKKDGMFFPLSINVRNSCLYRKTFPRAVFQQIEPPFKTVKKLYFPTTRAQDRNKLLEPSFIEQAAQGNDGEVPLEIHHQETWRSFTKQDGIYAVGFRDIIPNGFVTERISENCLFERPGWEKAIFDPNAPLGEFEKRANPNKNEVEDREFIENNQELRFKWSGCAQLRGCLTNSKLFHCCSKQMANFSDENEELHRWRELHSRVECARNEDLKVVLGNLDLNKKTATGESMIHMYIIRNLAAGPINRIGVQAQEIIEDAKIKTERGYSQMDLTPLGQNGAISPVAEWNIGLMQVSQVQFLHYTHIHYTH